MMKYIVLKELRYILLLLLIVLYACDVPEKDASLHLEANGCISSVINDISNEYANRMQQLYDWTDAVVSANQQSGNNQQNRLRTRRYERVSSSWPLRTNTHQQYAALQNYASTISHSINRIVAVSRRMPLNLPAEQICFPFHGFW